MVATAKKPPLKPININTATSEELQQVPGIGPVTADKILQMRKSYGAFKSVDDLLAVKGLGKKRLEKMRKYLTVSRAVASKPAANNQQPRNAPPPAVEAEAPPN
jgi:competence ComEA-like helix-hairpin-helix protein